MTEGSFTINVPYVDIGIKSNIYSHYFVSVKMCVDF